MRNLSRDEARVGSYVIRMLHERCRGALRAWQCRVNATAAHAVRKRLNLGSGVSLDS